MTNPTELTTFIEDIQKHVKQINTVQRQLSQVVSEYNMITDKIKASVKSGASLSSEQLNEIFTLTEKVDNTTQLLNTSADLMFLKIKKLEKKV